MYEKKVARAGIDRAGGTIGTGAKTVFTNNKKTAQVGSIIIDKPNKGDIIVKSPPIVYAENKIVAIEGAITAGGRTVQTGSKNVFAGNAAATFIGVEPSDPVYISSSTQTAVAQQVIEYVLNPVKSYNPQAALDGLKLNYAGTVDDATTSTSTVMANPVSEEIIPFLDRILEEASRGQWRESGQKGNPSNKNILNIWTNLGYPDKYPWTTDQTAWCMGFVNFVLKACGYRYVQTSSAEALPNNPQRWGAISVPKSQAQPGDIAFWSYSHVSFVYTANKGEFTFVGGNQNPNGVVNNPNDGDVTIAYPKGIGANISTWVSCWRPSKII